MYSTLSDEELWQNIKDGNHQAFSSVVKRYNSKLYSFIKRRTGSEDDAKDILQELFISLWNNREKSELKSSLSSYLYGAAKYVVIDWQIKNKNTVKRVELLLDESQLKSHTHSVEMHMIAAELKNEILELVDRLPQTIRTVFKMSRLDHKTNSEIAQELHLSDKTVRNNLSLALNFLRKHLGRSLNTITFCILLDRIFLK